MQGSLFNEIADLRSTTLLKKDSGTGVFLQILRKFLSITFFYRKPPVAASTDFNTCDKAYSVSKSFTGHHLNEGHKPDILLAGTCRISFILYLERKRVQF